MGKFVAKKATRVNKKLRLFVSGVPGAGKTPCSLALAKGLTSHIESPRIMVLDTEYGRASLYAGSPDMPEFDVVEWDYQAYGAIANSDYIEFLEYAVEEKADIVIIDSLTQQWENIQDLAARSSARNDMAKWRDAKGENLKLMNRILYYPLDIICTCRSKIKTSIDPETRKPVVMGEGAQIEGNTPYIFDFVFYIDRDSHTAVVEKVPSDLAKTIRTGVQMTEVTGTIIRNWLDKGVDPEKAQMVALLKQRLAEYETATGSPYESGQTDYYEYSVDEIIALGKQIAQKLQAGGDATT